MYQPLPAHDGNTILKKRTARLRSTFPRENIVFMACISAAGMLSLVFFLLRAVRWCNPAVSPG